MKRFFSYISNQPSDLLMVNELMVLVHILSDTRKRKKVTKAGNFLARNKFQNMVEILQWLLLMKRNR